MDVRAHYETPVSSGRERSTLRMWHRIRAPGDRAPAQQLDRTLCEIGQRFGAARRDWVMMELE
jgi:hypothetical protein